MKPEMTHGDFRMMMTKELWAALERVMNAKSALRTPYYVHVRIADHYQGQATASAMQGVPTKEMNFGGRKVAHTRLFVFTCPVEAKLAVNACASGVCKAYMGRRADGGPVCPVATPQLGTILFRVDNRKGEMECVYALPPDRPHDAEDSDNYGTLVEKTAESAKGIPLVWN